MIKNNKYKLIISSIVIMLPSLLCILAYKLFGNGSIIAGAMNPVKAFIIIPATLLAVHLLCIILTSIIDKSYTQRNKKIASFIYFIMPVMSFFVCGMLLAVIFGHTPNTVFTSILVLLGAMFIFIGNYMPKTTRNRTIGLRTKWTLSSDENWLATHRLAGKVFVATGVLCLLAIPLPTVALPFVLLAVILASGIIPTAYSYRFYKKQLADGTATKESFKTEYKKMVKNPKTAIIFSALALTLVLTLVPLLMFTGNIDFTLNDSALLVDADFHDDLTLNYDKIDSLEYRENGVSGTRMFGFNSARLALGMFNNEEFGNYTRYTYAGKLPAIVIKSGDNVIVIGTNDAAETRAIYDKLVEATNK